MFSRSLLHTASFHRLSVPCHISSRASRRTTAPSPCQTVTWPSLDPRLQPRAHGTGACSAMDGAMSMQDAVDVRPRFRPLCLRTAMLKFLLAPLAHFSGLQLLVVAPGHVGHPFLSFHNALQYTNISGGTKTRKNPTPGRPPGAQNHTKLRKDTLCAALHKSNKRRPTIRHRYVVCAFMTSRWHPGFCAAGWVGLREARSAKTGKMNWPSKVRS